MPAVLRFNAAIDDGRLAAVGVQLGFSSIQQLGNAMEALLAKCNLNGLLADCGLSGAQLEVLVPEMFLPGRADNNLRPADEVAIRAILTNAAAYLPALRY